MNLTLKASIEQLIRVKRGFEFEATMNQIYLIQHTSDGYQPTRERSDDGAEGLIRVNRTIVAAYGPDKYDEKKFLKKIEDDFDDFLKKWAAQYPNWKMHYNSSLAPELIRITERLSKLALSKGISVDDIQVFGVEQIMQMIEEKFSTKKQRQLASYLGVPKELMIFDQIKGILDDLIKGIIIESDTIEYKLQIDVNEKIELNYSIDDRNAAREEYEDYLLDGTLIKIGEIISSYNDEEINTLKIKVKREFNKIDSKNFKNKLSVLTELLVNKYSSGDDYEVEHYIRAILVYFFEQCLIGEKTKSELEKHKL